MGNSLNSEAGDNNPDPNNYDDDDDDVDSNEDEERVLEEEEILAAAARIAALQLGARLDPDHVHNTENGLLERLMAHEVEMLASTAAVASQQHPRRRPMTRARARQLEQEADKAGTAAKRRAKDHVDRLRRAAPVPEPYGTGCSGSLPSSSSSSSSSASTSAIRGSSGPNVEMREAYLQFQADTASRSGYPATSISKPMDLCIVQRLRLRQLGLTGWESRYEPHDKSKRVLLTSHHNPAVGLTDGQKACLTSFLMPNRRVAVDHIQTKTFCCGWLDGGRRLATASQDGCVRLYDWSRPTSSGGGTSRLRPAGIVSVPHVGWSILDMAVSRGTDALVALSTWTDSIFLGKLTATSDKPLSGEPDGGWRHLHITDFTEGDEYRMRHFGLFSVRFSWDQTELLTGGSRFRLYAYDLFASRTTINVQAHDDDVNSVCYGDTAGSPLLFTAGDDGLCKAWDRRLLGGSASYAQRDVQPVGVFAGHRDGIVHIAARGDERYILTNGKDQSIKVWDVRHFSSPDAVTLTKTLVSRQRWDYRWQPVPPSNLARHEPFKGESSLITLRGHTVMNTLVRARFSPAHTGHRFIYTGCARGDVIVYDMVTGEKYTTLRGHRAVVRDSVWHPRHNMIATTSWDGETALWSYDGRVSDDNDDEISDDDDVYEGRIAIPTDLD